MRPEWQEYLQQAQQWASVLWPSMVCGIFVCLVVCTLFALLIYRKLCQIHRAVLARGASADSSDAPATDPSPEVSEGDQDEATEDDESARRKRRGWRDE
jgi:hypothetical protein